MKHWLLGVALVCLGSAASAQVVPIGLSTGTTCAPVSISSSAPTAVFVPAAGPVAGGFQLILSLYNLSAASKVFCSQDVAVSSQTASSHLGWPVQADNYRDWTILPYQPWKCMGGSTAAAITAVVCLTQ